MIGFPEQSVVLYKVTVKVGDESAEVVVPVVVVVESVVVVVLSAAELASEDEAAEELESTAEELASGVGLRPLRLTIESPCKQGIA